MKLSDKIKGLIGSVAPVLGAALGGPLGGIAGKFIGDALGVAPDQIEQTLATASPDILVLLRKLDREFEAKMAELEVDVFKLEVADTSNAREMAKSSGAWPQIGLSAAYTLGYFALLFLLLNGTLVIAAATASIIEVLLGVMTAAQIQIMNFWFGSSRGSAQKSEHLHRISQQK